LSWVNDHLVSSFTNFFSPLFRAAAPLFGGWLLSFFPGGSSPGFSSPPFLFCVIFRCGAVPSGARTGPTCVSVSLAGCFGELSLTLIFSTVCYLCSFCAVYVVFCCPPAAYSFFFGEDWCCATLLNQARIAGPVPPTFLLPNSFFFVGPADFAFPHVRGILMVLGKGQTRAFFRWVFSLSLLWWPFCNIVSGPPASLVPRTPCRCFSSRPLKPPTS